ncbi:MAG: 2OG-Fe(II) oxygenase, partial [Myxococcales bacterium]|nr:2OG-Fe(II) oxygenase [Myxococcales bacterium]
DITDLFDPSIWYTVLEHFLGPARDHLLANVLSRRDAFRPATVVREAETEAVVDDGMRRAMTLDDVSFIEEAFVERLKEVLAPTLERLGMKGFPVGRIELQVTASGDRDYFRMHRDSGDDSTRELSFVYFFHQEPRKFSGGELRLYDDRGVQGRAHADRSQLLSPRQDTIVFFPARSPHELLPVRVYDGKFEHSRFTLNGWIHRAT